MRIVDIAVKQLYRFNCPNCGSKLEGGKVSKFQCPVCRKECFIPWNALRKRIIYENQSAE